jgi:hypothetical protein
LFGSLALLIYRALAAASTRLDREALNFDRLESGLIPFQDVEESAGAKYDG